MKTGRGPATRTTPPELGPLTVGERGLEPLHPFEYWHLKPARLPFRHSPEWNQHASNPIWVVQPARTPRDRSSSNIGTTMGIQGLEHRLERMVDGVFRRSNASIRPIELGRRLIREMDDHRSVDVKGQRIVPNEFIVTLSQHDHDSFFDIADALRTELLEAVYEYARDEGYHFMGPVNVDFRVDDTQRPGRFGVVSQLRQPEDGKRPGAIVMPSGERVALTDAENLIGRVADCQIILSDENVSRNHASIRRVGTGFVIVDRGSTNGTYVNGERITTDRRLVHGDVISVATINLRFEAS